MSIGESHGSRLEQALAAEPRIVYAFAADSDGKILAEAGDPAALPHKDVVNVCKRPEVIQSRYAEIQEYKRTDSRMVPRMLAQGQTTGVIDSPREGLVVSAFGTMPRESYDGTPQERVAWISAFRKIAKACISAAYA